MAILCGRAGRLTRQNGGCRPGQAERNMREVSDVVGVDPMEDFLGFVSKFEQRND